MKESITFSKYVLCDVFVTEPDPEFKKLAIPADLYSAIWFPNENRLTTVAGSLVPKLERGVEFLYNNPEYYTQFGGFKLYKRFIDFLTHYIRACKAHPEAKITVQH